MARVILPAREAELPRPLDRAIAQGRVAGLLWFRSALGSTVAQARERISRARSLWPSGSRAIFSIDEEGGLIQQLDGLRDDSGQTWPRLPSARSLGRAGDASFAFAHGRETGRRLRLLGLDVDLAPVVDLDPGGESGVLGTRCFGSDPEAVADLALAWLRGLASAGIHGCLKHYPGHGRTRLDSHLDLPRIDESEDDQRHLRPFERIAREWNPGADGPAPGVLSAHLLPPRGARPVSLDRAALARIPALLGPVWTDSLDMGALAAFGSMAERGSLALAAGSDLLVVGADLEGGLSLAASLDRAQNPRTIALLDSMPARAIPDPWPLAAMEEVAGRALAISARADGEIPRGEWDWLLPERVGPYGPVAEPRRIAGSAAGSPVRRSIRTVRRYDAGDPAAPAAMLAAMVDTGSAGGAGGVGGRPVLFGWVHRGPEDQATRALVEAHAGGRPIAAVAHLLDGPDERGKLSPLWTAETCGFGEAEMAALIAAWETA